MRKTCSNASQTTEVDRADVARYLNVPLQFDMRSEIQKATHTLLNFCADNALEGASDQVPADLIASAWGLAFLTTMQAGFFFSARVGRSGDSADAGRLERAVGRLHGRARAGACRSAAR